MIVLLYRKKSTATMNLDGISKKNVREIAGFQIVYLKI